MRTRGRAAADNRRIQVDPEPLHEFSAPPLDCSPPTVRFRTPTGRTAADPSLARRDSRLPTVHLPWGLQLRIDPRESIGSAVWRLGLYDLAVSETLWRLTSPGDLTVDVGANIGHMTSIREPAPPAASSPSSRTRMSSTTSPREHRPRRRGPADRPHRSLPHRPRRHREDRPTRHRRSLRRHPQHRPPG